MTFDLTPLAAILGSRDFKKNKWKRSTAKRLAIIEKLQRYTDGKPGADFHNSPLPLYNAAPYAPVLSSRQVQQINKTDIQRKRFDMREKLQTNAVRNPGSGFQDPSLPFTYHTRHIGFISRSRDFRQINETKLPSNVSRKVTKKTGLELSESVLTSNFHAA